MPNSVKTSVLRLERRGCAMVATIDDPATRNAISDPLLADFETLFEHCRDDPSVRAIVLRGNKRIFCAGADLSGKTLGGKSGDPYAEMVELSIRGAQVYGGLNAFPKPVIVVVEGAAMGGGMGLTACADIVLAGPNAFFALSEARLGLVAAQIAPFVVSRIGPAITRRLALTGSRFKAEEALHIGMVDELLPDSAAIDARLDSILADIEACGPRALAATKKMLLDLPNFDITAFTHSAAAVFADAALGEGEEGIAAFKEKRPPKWATQ